MMSVRIKNTSREEIIKYLIDSPDQETMQFQIHISNLSERASDIEGLLTEVVSDEKQYGGASYAAFCCLSISYRRRNDLVKMGALFDAHRARFRKFNSFPLFESLYFLARGTEQSIHSALKYIREALSKLPSHDGVRAAYADIICTALEIGVDLPSSLIDDAEEKITDAICSNPSYAKYPYLLAKVQYHKGDLYEAERNIRLSMDLEDTDRPTYAFRLAEYQRLQISIHIKKYGAEVDAKIEQLNVRAEEFQTVLRASVSDARSQVLVQLGFFSGLLAIILSSVNVAASFQAYEAISVLFSLTGAIMFCWFSLSFILLETLRWRRLAIVLSLSLALLASGLGFLIFDFRQG